MNTVTIFCAALILSAVSVSGKSYDGDTDVDWWKTAVFYQIYPRSFKDSNNDGNGDLKGIIQKLPYLKEVGVEACWLSPVYKSPQVDNGYDISDYRDIEPMFGTLDDLRQLIDEAHKLGIKVILDYVPNHTSDKHEWFQRSLKGDPKYSDYYIWKNATYVDGERRPPNNWLSDFKDSAWEWKEERQQYYYHQFSIGQPDLNFRNPAVVEDMKDLLRFWLNFGADGFRMDTVNNLFENDTFLDEPPSGKPGIEPNDADSLIHIYTVDQPETFDMIYQWREVLDEFNKQNNTYNRMMVTEVYSDPNTTMLYYGTPDGSRKGAHFTFNFLTFVITLQEKYTAQNLSDAIRLWFNHLPEIYTSNWVLGNHDQPRVSTRLGVENIDALNMLVAILPGAQITYQGEEIGQENGEVTCDEGYDPKAIKNCSTFNQISRDFERTPFQWNNSTNAGFNEGAKTWLPVSKKYVETNLVNENVPDINSHYNIYKQLLKLRREFRKSSRDNIYFDPVSGTENIFYAQRITDNANYVLYYNVGDSEEVIKNPVVEGTLTVAVRSINSNYKEGDTFDVRQPLKPREAVLNKVTN